MTASDTRSPRSRAQLVEALQALLGSTDPGDISISSLCAEAGVSRPTFYQYFATLDEVAVAGIERRFAELRSGLPTDLCGPDAARELLTRFLTELDGERPAWRRTIGSSSGMMGSRDAVESWFSDRLADKVPDADPVVLRYAAAGFLGAVRAWLRQDPGPDRPTPEELATTLGGISERLLSPGSPAS
ncbi:TetR/AcrR family transcriptional regulator [Nocardioides mangrovi]|uniref:TetR/AcrR family transcriptional regulator n=1 Tax=Nocardioides mangrovi TaxID=2874580 RepID=A0ABS7UFH5_9ACTN|nr:TetR/AcrR family transcriptional regulator [Nocardioides mangrovi]MBZ5739407.1 TetR/AcrR family transcriptional regulator [Nocardioides mangrovi]